MDENTLFHIGVVVILGGKLLFFLWMIYACFAVAADDRKRQSPEPAPVEDEDEAEADKKEAAAAMRREHFNLLWNIREEYNIESPRVGWRDTSKIIPPKLSKILSSLRSDPRAKTGTDSGFKIMVHELTKLYAFCTSDRWSKNNYFLVSDECGRVYEKYAELKGIDTRPYPWSQQKGIEEYRGIA